MAVVEDIQPLLLDRRGMAKAISVSERTLDNLRQNPGFPVVRVPGTRKILFHPGEVVAWLRKQSEAPERLSEKLAREKADVVFGR